MYDCLMTMITPNVTPMMAQWHDCKQSAKDALLFFRLGDFYEAFYEDAEIIAKHLSLTLTARQSIPMCGVPFHTAEAYIDKLIAKGYKVAVAEQIGDPENTKGIVKREIVRIVTPGTLVTSQLLTDKKNNFFASIVQVGSTFGLSIIDLSTGQFSALEFDSEQELLDELFRLRPSEFLVSKKFQEDHPVFFKELSQNYAFLLNQKDSLDLKFGQDVLLCHFQINHLDGFGLRGKVSAIQAAGSLLLYLKEELNLSLDHILNIQVESSSSYMGIDRATFKNLELTESNSEAGKHTLLEVLDKTYTPMGGRLMNQWVKHPLIDIQEIQLRQAVIAKFIENLALVNDLTKSLSKIRDIERLIMRISSNVATARDVLALGVSLSYIPEVFSVLSHVLNIPHLEQGTALEPLKEKILASIVDNPPIRVSDGEIFKSGYHQELDYLRAISKESTEFLMQYQNTLREQTGIKTLKVGFTRAFGYYIEVSRAQSEKIPENFQRRQTLVNGERFITDELKKFEHQVLSAEERAKAIEIELFELLKKEIAKQAPLIHSVSKEIARFDCLLSLAVVAHERKFVCPVVDESVDLEIIEGRHPVVEHVVGASNFISNDTILNENQQMMLITGPNMAGKSTYIRQVALIAIMAQLGSYVPAKRAKIGIVDRVFSRIGASDDLARGQSTFMVEMSETANILKNATSRSLVLLDEIGRGTSTYDGISIAWAVAEYLLTTHRKQAKTLFATHYWELTQLSEKFPHAQNFQTAIQEVSSGIVFLRKIIQGGTDKSYGIHVAKLAGLPPKVLKRAEEMLKDLELKQIRQKPKKEEQLFLFGTVASQELSFVEELKNLQINDVTPLQALQLLSRWKLMVQG